MSHPPFSSANMIVTRPERDREDFSSLSRGRCFVEGTRLISQRGPVLPTAVPPHPRNLITLESPRLRQRGKSDRAERKFSESINIMYLSLVENAVLS